MWFYTIYNSIVQAVQELSSNKMRSFLSSLGITIGIFCIIAVLSAVDSLEENINSSFEKLGHDVIYVDKNPWSEPPHETWWKYAHRPAPDHQDLEAVKAGVNNSEYASLTVFIPGQTLKYKSSSVRGAFIAGVTYEYADVIKLEFDAGRYFTPFEYSIGANRVILGNVLAEALFGNIDPIGKDVKFAGRKFQVVGVLEKEGSSLIQIIPYDEAIIISYNTAKKLINVRSGASWGTLLNIKAKPGVKMVDLRDETTGVLRAHRKLRPREEDNFAVNEMSIFTKLLAPVFTTLNAVGFVIGIFAIVVGIFSVANIMFVSVKERTSIIGIKKALGAKKWVILLEFLIESVLLCIVGGAIGLAMVVIILFAVSRIQEFQLFVSQGNIIIALSLALGIGVIAGIIPAIQAARMDPVVAMRK